MPRGGVGASARATSPDVVLPRASARRRLARLTALHPPRFLTLCPIKSDRQTPPGEAAMNPPFERSTPDEATRHHLAWAAWPADMATPVRAFLALRSRGRHACLLESVEGPARLARYS